MNMNYGGFGKKPCEGQAFGGYLGGTQQTETPPSAFGSYSMQGKPIPNEQSSPFKPVEQFRTSLSEVARSNMHNLRLYQNAVPSAMPDMAYLKTKRTSVFHRAFESKDIENFKPPIYEKTREEIESLTELFKTSFLTKNIDSSQHIVLAYAMQKKTINAG